jgi:hypothetical protein
MQEPDLWLIFLLPLILFDMETKDLSRETRG